MKREKTAVLFTRAAQFHPSLLKRTHFCTACANLHTDFNGHDLLQSRQRTPGAFGANLG